MCKMILEITCSVQDELWFIAAFAIVGTFGVMALAIAISPVLAVWHRWRKRSASS